MVDSRNFSRKLPRIFHYNMKERNRIHPIKIAKQLLRLKQVYGITKKRKKNGQCD